MADVDAFNIRPAREGSGEQHTQFTKSSSDLSGNNALVLVPAVAGKTGIIDYLAIKTTAAETWKLTSDTGEIIPESTTVANTWEVCDTEISADKKGLFLKLTVSNGAVDVFCKYHYDT